MEIDKILYIFGSFSRKKDSKEKRKSLQVPQSSISAGNSPIRHRSTSQPVSHFENYELDIPPRTSAYGSYAEKRGKLEEWQCGLCRSELVEPRLLSCLHSFCTGCLQGLHHGGEVDTWNDVAELLDSYCNARTSLAVAGGTTYLITVSPMPGSYQEAGSSRSTSGAGSAGSGYESEFRENSGSDTSWAADKASRGGIFTRKVSGKSVQLLICPTCNAETQLPLGGIAALPLNYVLLRRIASSGRKSEASRSSVLCDLCTSDNTAESHCNQCLVSVCKSCEAAHGRRKSTSRHSLRPLDLQPVRFCSQHPKAELCVYCATCQEVICRDCCIIAHTGHALANSSRAAAERARLLRDACERARRVPELVGHASRSLAAQEIDVDLQASRVEAEVSTWAQQYRRAVEAHGVALSTAAARARAKYRLKYREHQHALERRAAQAEQAVKFADEVLSEAKENELLSLSGPVIRRLERVCDVSALTQPAKCELRFASTAPASGGLVGRLLTTAPDLRTCRLITDGLQDLRVGVNHEAILELRDSDGERIWCGGEPVAGYFRRKDSSAVPFMAKVVDRNDGTYSLVICAPSPGAYYFAVTLNNKPIQGSPFPCAARVGKPHTGQYHCCAFCSSGGRKDAACACGGTMGGGYKGCGHGHAGHPGRHHWSCCGNTDRRSQCTRDSVYHFSL